MKIDNNKISIVIILLLLALIIYYLSKNMRDSRVLKTTKCCTLGNEFYSAGCENDVNCTCDNSLCQTEWVGNQDDVISDPVFEDDTPVMTSGCCEGVAYNYDPACLTDPNCNCDMSLCTSAPPVWSTCYGACNSGYTSLYTIDTCGSGQATNYPFTQAPYCQDQQA